MRSCSKICGGWRLRRCGFLCLTLAAACLGLPAWAAPASSTSLACSTTQNGKAVINEVNTNADFIEVYLLQATAISNWALYVDSTKVKTLGAGSCAVNGTATADSGATYPAGTFIYCATNMNPSNNEVLLVDKNTALASGNATVIDYLSYGTPSPSAKWSVPAACGTVYPAHAASNQDIARIPDGSGSLLDNDDDSTPGATNAGITGLSKTVSSTTPTVGQNVTFTVAVTAGAGSAAPTSNVSVSDLLPAGLTYVSSVPSSGTYDAATGWWSIGTVGAGATATLTITATVTLAGTITNTATLYKNGINTGRTASVSLTATAASVSLYDAVEVGAAKGTPIYTKLAGTAFNLDVLALDATGSLLGSYSLSPTVTLVDASSGSCASMSVLSGVTVTPSSSLPAVRRTYAFTATRAAANVRVRITDGSVTSCSTDNFAIRPAYFNSVVATATQSASTGTPVFKAGTDSFSLTVTTGESGYNGTPKISAVDAHGGAVAAGIVAGSFVAASAGTASGSAFTYSEVGNFRFLGYNPATDAGSARGIYDDTFTAVDQSGDCVGGSYSTVLSGGKYGCLVGLYDQGADSPNSAYFGRFIPDHFQLSAVTLTNRADLAACAASTFTYMDESLAITFSLTALNGGGSLTQNYTGSYARLAPAAADWAATGTGKMGLWATASGYASGGASGCKVIFAQTAPWATTFACASGNLPGVAASTSRVAVSSSLASSLSWSNGTGTGTAYPVLARADAPDGPYAALAFGLAPVDADDVALQPGALDMDADNSGGGERQTLAATSVRHGRLKIANAFGPAARSLQIPFETQYWNGLGFVKNTLDSCTALSTANIGKGNYQGGLNAANAGALNLGVPAAGACTALGGSSAVSGGSGCMVLAAPASAVSGSVDLVLDLGASATPNMCPAWTPSSTAAANLAYLRGRWCSSTYDYDPTARATFGVYGSSAKKGVIYLREGY